MPGFTFPAVGPLGLRFPTFPTRFLRFSVLCSAKTSRSSSRSPSVLPCRLPIPCMLSFLCVPSLRARSWARPRPIERREVVFRLTGPPLLTGFFYKETTGSPKFPSYPFELMHWSQIPVVTWLLAAFTELRLRHTCFKGFPKRGLTSRIPYPVYLTQPGLLPSGASKPSAFTPELPRAYPLKTTTIHISGLNTVPVFLIHPAQDSRYRVCPRISLLTCRLSFGQVGLAPTG